MKAVGVALSARDSQSIRINHCGRELEYKILAINAFSSARKRMSILVELPDGGVQLFCKGADNILLELSNCAAAERRRLDSDLSSFARWSSHAGGRRRRMKEETKYGLKSSVRIQRRQSTA